MSTKEHRFGLWTGVGIVASSMIGTGVFLSAGFMAQDLGPGPLLLAWVAGAVIALSGARAYGAVAMRLPRSGGEYRYLHDLFHPWLGYFAGWATLFVGFSAPLAANARAAAVFAGTLVPVPHEGLLAAFFVVALTLFHARDLSLSRWTQDSLALVKAALVLGFAALGLFAGHNTWPTWTPPNVSAGFPVAAFATSLFFVAFAFTGWNGAVYVAEEFRNPKRDVPRSMLVGCGLVAVLYLLVNWVFVANLSPERAAVVFRYEEERVTLGHLIAADMLGPLGGKAMSALALLSFLSAMSAFVLTGPRAYAAMAADGFLPRALVAREGRPPVGSILFQGVVTLLLLHTHGLRDILQNVGAILTLLSALVAASLFRLRFRPGLGPPPDPLSLVAAGIFVVAAAWMLYHGFRTSAQLWLWVAVLVVVSATAYAGTHLLRRRRGPSG